VLRNKSLTSLAVSVADHSSAHRHRASTSVRGLVVGALGAHHRPLDFHRSIDHEDRHRSSTERGTTSVSDADRAGQVQPWTPQTSVRQTAAALR